MTRFRILVTCPDCNMQRHTDPCAVRRAKRLGYPLRCSSCAAKARYGHPEKVRQRAALLHARGYNAREVSEHLADENVIVAPSTVYTWVSL